MSYSINEYKEDKAAIDAAKVELNCLVLGQGTKRCDVWGEQYDRIACYFGYKKQANDITHYGDEVRRVARMFRAIRTADRISGFDCNIYASLLEQIEKKIKSMRVFKRKQKIKCFVPQLHRQPCYCARLEAIQAASSIANAPIEADMKEELQAKVSGALILDKELEDAS